MHLFQTPVASMNPLFVVAGYLQQLQKNGYKDGKYAECFAVQ